MKKYFILIALILSVSTAYSESMENEFKEINEIQEQFYQSPSSPIPEVKLIEGSVVEPISGMPLFKKTRIKITNYFREKDYKQRQEQLKEEQKQALNENSQEIESSIEQQDFQNEKPVKHKFRFKKTKEENSDNVELQGGVNEQVTSKEAQLDADNIDFDNKTMEIIATGSPVLYFPPQNTVIKADKIVYNNESNKIKAFGNVEVIKDGNTILGDYLQINMNEENSFMDNVDSKISFLSIKSRTSEMDGDKITLYDGRCVSKAPYVLRFETSMIGGNSFNNMIIDPKDRSSLSNEEGETPINIKAKEVIYNAKDNIDTITFKNASVRYGDFDLFKFRSLTAHTNKERNFFEANYPEFGSQGRLGMFAGPGFVFDTPLQKGSTIKIIPMLNYKDGIGIGGMLKYRSATNTTDLAYGTSSDIFILRGHQYLDDKLYLHYGSNAYMDEWFLGYRMAKYHTELVYHDKAIVQNTLGKGLDLSFKHRFGVGYMHNSDYTRDGEHIPSANIGTMRTRYMAEAVQTLFDYTNKEKRQQAKLGFIMQGSAALYGTGDTQFIGRMGPYLHTQYKNWVQDVIYFASTYQDGSPMQMYDCFRYGKGSLMLREAFRVNKYLTLAWAGTVTLTNDSPSDDAFQENLFIISFGPDDFKVNLGYDWYRQQTYFSFIVAMNTKGSSLDYEKMVIKNYDKLSKKDDEKIELKVFDNPEGNSAVYPKKMMYAEVIDIEDPNKELL